MLAAPCKPSRARAVASGHSRQALASTQSSYMRADRLGGPSGLAQPTPTPRRPGRVSALPPLAVVAPPQLGAAATGRLALQSGLLKTQGWLALAAGEPLLSWEPPAPG